MRYINILLSLCLLLLIACNPVHQETSSPEENITPEDILTDGEIEDGIQVTEDGVKYLVNPDKIRRGIRAPGDIRDAIPSIDDPKFRSVEESDEHIQDNELVMFIDYKGEKRIYPFQILVSHEIVNENIQGDPLLITYCPLCGSGIAYERLIDGEEVEFGTSGKLFNSNLVMYDRKTNTYWTQIDGLAILGEKTGTKLTPVNIDTVTWGDIKDAHPDAQVLVGPRGDSRYGNDPYGSYYEETFIWFPLENEDTQTGIHPKDVVFGIIINDEARAYQESKLKDKSKITDTLGGEEIILQRADTGIITITDSDGNIIPKERDFWFAWYAFHPETSVYGLE